MTSIQDAALAAALAAAGDDPAELRVSHVRTLEGLEAVRSLEVLEIDGAELEALDILSKLPNLRSLAIRYSSVTDFSALEGCHGVEHLDLSFSNLESLEPVTRMRGLRRMDVVACPWTDEDALTRIRERVERVWYSPGRDRRITKLLWESGTGLTFGTRYGRWLLVRPGCAQQRGVSCDCLVGISPSSIPQLLQSVAGKPAGLFDAIAERVTTPRVSDPSVGAHVEEGFGSLPRSWVEQSRKLPGQLAQALSRLLDGFPSLRWGRQTSAGLAQMKSAALGALPDWYSEFLTTLSITEPGPVSWVRLQDSKSGIDGFYSLDLIFEAWDTHGDSLRKFDLLPIALERAHQPTLLAINTHGSVDDAVVVVPARPGAVASAAKLQVAFSSFTALLDAIDQVELEDGISFSRHEPKDP